MVLLLETLSSDVESEAGSDEVDEEVSFLLEFDEGHVEGQLAATLQGEAAVRDSDDDEEEEEEAEEEEGSLRPFGELDSAGRLRRASKVSQERSASAAFDNLAIESGVFESVVTQSAEKQQSWEALSLSRPLLRAVAALGYASPTPIQERVVPLALAGRDVCASAPTGSGKTAAFVLPFLERILGKNASTPAIRVLVVLPTRELASQCEDVVRSLSAFANAALDRGLTTALIVGGAKDLRHQEALLRRRPDIVVATPGRFVDHPTNSAGVAFDDVEVCVLDEADRLLDLGFEDQLKEIIKVLPGGQSSDNILGSGSGKRQTLLFSATFGAKVEVLARLSLKRPVRVKIDAAAGGTVDRLTQDFVKLSADAHRDGQDSERLEREAVFLALLSRLVGNGGSGKDDEKDDNGDDEKKKKNKPLAIAFFDTRAQAKRIAKVLKALRLPLEGEGGEDEVLFSDYSEEEIKLASSLPVAVELHGGLPQTERSANLAAFQRGEASLLLCTDVGSRGLDVDLIRTVLNYDMPRTVETYVHRVGRTARAGRSGLSVTIVGAGRRAVLKDFLRARQADVDASLKTPEQTEIRSRSVSTSLVASFREAIVAKESVIRDFERQQAANVEQTKAEKDTERLLNLVRHADEIKARPRREWFQSNKEKSLLKDKEKSQKDEETLAADEGRKAALLAKQRKMAKDLAKKNLGVSVRGKHALNDDIDDKGHRLTRKKRRRLEAAEAQADNGRSGASDDASDDDDDPPRRKAKPDAAAIQKARESAEAKVKRQARTAKKAEHAKKNTRDKNDATLVSTGEETSQKKRKIQQRKTTFDDDDDDFPQDRDGPSTSRKFVDFDPSRVGQRKKKKYQATGNFKTKVRYKRR